jgi:hypothetical protein
MLGLSDGDASWPQALKRSISGRLAARVKLAPFPKSNFCEGLGIRGCFLSHDGCVLGYLAAVIAQGYIHEDISAGCAETHHQGFGILAGFAALFGGVDAWGMNAKVKSLIVESGHGVANDLVGEFADRFTHKIVVGFRHCDSGQAAGELHGRREVDIKDDSAFNLTGECDFGGDSFAPVGSLFHAEILDRNRRLQTLG